MSVGYEWDIEEIDEDGEVIDHNHVDSLNGVVFDGDRFCLVLVKNVWNALEGLINRAWAYAELKDGVWTLPDTFCDGSKVPKRFVKELTNYKQSV